MGRDAEGPSGVHREMMEILTRPETVEKRLGGRKRYPRQIKLLNLLNLRPRRVLRLDAKQSIPPNIFVTIIFVLWGTVFGLLSVIAENFELPHLGSWRTYIIEGAYYLGYLPFPVLGGRIILKRLGFRASFVSGLYIYALGALLFWPASILISFPMVFISNFIIGSGLGTLEMTATLYIAICGPLDYSEIRVCVAQGFQGLGGLASRLIADKLLLHQGAGIDGVIRVQWVYLAIALLNVVLAIVFYYIPIPEASEKDLDELAQLRPANNASGIFGVRVVYQTLFCGVWTHFFQLAAIQAHAAAFPSFVHHALPSSNLSAVYFFSIATTLASVSRFFAAFIQWAGFKPRWLLLICSAASIVWAIICLETSGILAVVINMLFWFTSSPIYPINYAISLRRLGAQCKTASSLLAACYCARFVSYLARYGVEVAVGEPHPYILVVIFSSVAMLSPLYLNLVPAARRQVDPMKDEWIGDFDTGAY